MPPTLEWRAGANGVCLAVADWTALRVFHAEIGHWMRAANRALDYHEAPH